ncbi:MAG: DUF4349 domain-containing protein [Anaerolineales bacterium]
MKIKRTLISFIILAILLTACASAATPIIEEMVQYEAEAPAEKPAAQPQGPTAPDAPPTDGDAPGNPGQLAYAPVGDKMVIKDAEIEVLVQSTDVAIAQVNQLTADYDGYIISTQTWYENGFKHATLRLGIPSSSFETVLNQLRDLGLKVIQESASGQDVSNEYVDLQSKLTNLEATAARVREFLNDAKTIEETLTVSAQLAELEAQIEQVKGQMRYYEGRSAYSTVTVNLVPQHPTPTPTLTPTPTPTPTPLPGWSANDAFENASHVLVDLTQATVDLLIWVGIVLLPIVAVLGVVAWSFRRVMLKLARSNIRS